jgi:hypothetical protein
MRLERVPTSRKVFSLSFNFFFSFFSISLCLFVACMQRKTSLMWGNMASLGAPTRVRAFHYCGFPCIVSWRHPFSSIPVFFFFKHLLFLGHCSLRGWKIKRIFFIPLAGESIKSLNIFRSIHPRDPFRICPHQLHVRVILLYLSAEVCKIAKELFFWRKRHLEIKGFFLCIL